MCHTAKAHVWYILQERFEVILTGHHYHPIICHEQDNFGYQCFGLSSSTVLCATQLRSHGYFSIIAILDNVNWPT